MTIVKIKKTLGKVPDSELTSNTNKLKMPGSMNPRIPKAAIPKRK